MREGIHRRQFVHHAGPGVLGGALVSLAGCSTGATKSGRSGGTTAWGSRIAVLEERIPRLMEEHRVPGLSIALLNDGRLAWTQGFGVKDATSKARVDESTIFEAASMSKPVFAYAVMKLIEKGTLDLDVPLIHYTPERFLAGDPRLHLITARHVLSHTAGFQDSRSGEKPLKIHFAPGEKWMYSGEGYAYLQSVVTHLTGRVNTKECGRFEADLEVCATDFDAYMKTNLLVPFGMELSSYLWTAATPTHLARPHDAQGQPLSPRQPTAAGVARYGAMGGLLTTATDYAKFLIEVVRPKQADAFRLNPRSRSEMLHPQVKVAEGDGYSVFWALGWRVAQTAMGDLVSHGGDQTGYHSTSEFSAIGKTGYVILTNGDSGWKLIKELAPDISGWVHLNAAALY